MWSMVERSSSRGRATRSGTTSCCGTPISGCDHAEPDSWRAGRMLGGASRDARQQEIGGLAGSRGHRAPAAIERRIPLGVQERTRALERHVLRIRPLPVLALNRQSQPITRRRDDATGPYLDVDLVELARRQRLMGQVGWKGCHSVERFWSSARCDARSHPCAAGVRGSEAPTKVTSLPAGSIRRKVKKMSRSAVEDLTHSLAFIGPVNSVSRAKGAAWKVNPSPRASKLASDACGTAPVAICRSEESR